MNLRRRGSKDMLIRSKIAVGLAAALSVSAVGGVAFAASQGTLGSTSTGSSSLSATVTSLVLIDGVNDILLSAATANDDLEGNDPSICVYSNATDNLYEITASSTNGSGSFLLSDISSNTMAYTVKWTDADGTEVSLTEGAQTSSNLDGSATTDCTGAFSRVDVSVPAATWTTSPAGGYSDTLTLVVAPN